MAFSSIKSATEPFFKKAKSPRLMRKPITFRSVGVNAWNGPNYLLMTRMVTVFNHLTGWSCKVGMMIDPGSTDTYITNDLKRKLKLKSGPERSVNIVRFGDNSPSKKLSGPTVQLGVKCANPKEQISIEGLVVEDFLPALFCTELNSGDNTYLSGTCKDLPPGSFVKPDIFLGIKHLPLLKLNFKECCEKGLQWYDTTLGRSCAEFRINLKLE